MLGRAYAEPQGASNGASGSSGKKQLQKGQKKAKQQQQAGGCAALVHVYPELECYEAQADWTFSFPTPGRMEADGELQQRRLVMLVGAKGAAAARRQLARLLGDGST